MADKSIACVSSLLICSISSPSCHALYVSHKPSSLPFFFLHCTSATGNYLPDHTGHKFVDEAPLSTRRSTNLGGSPPVYEQGAAVEEVRESKIKKKKKKKNPSLFAL